MNPILSNEFMIGNDGKRDYGHLIKLSVTLPHSWDGYQRIKGNDRYFGFRLLLLDYENLK